MNSLSFTSISLKDKKILIIFWKWILFSDYESVLDDLFRDQPVPSVQYNYNDSERENRLAQESPAEWINSPQNYSPL